jgi:Cu+-exporting ATPase
MAETTGSTATLDITGMTCASCVARVEKRLQRLDGVVAEVNLATERARVIYPAEITAEQLVAAVESAGYSASVVPDRRGTEVVPATEANAGTEPAGSTPLSTRLIVSAVLAFPVIVLAMVPAWQFANWQWLSLALAAPVVVWGGYPFHRATWVNLRHGSLTMDTLITLGTGAAFLWSLWALFFGMAGMPGATHEFSLFTPNADATSAIYLEVAAGVTVFLLLGRYIEQRSKRTAGRALRALLELGAKNVTVLRGRTQVTIPIEELAVDDRFVVRPGETIATDGIVESGSAAVDASMLTGESVPLDVREGDPVTGATIASGGRLIVRATRVGRDTQLAQMARLVEAAQLGKGRAQRMADRISAIFVPIVITFAVGVLAAWVLTGHPLSSGFTAAVAVLIIACPCALGLATPVALLVGTSRGAQFGILITGPEALEQARGIDTVVLDKTGTITTGVMTLSEVTISDPAALHRAASLEAASEHPLARAIVAGSDESALAPVTDFVSTSGLGVTGIVEGTRVVVGRPAFAAEHGCVLSDSLAAAVDRAELSGATAVVVGWDGEVRGVLAVSDRVKPGAREAVARLTRLGLTPVLLTGDNERAAHAVAADVGIDRVVAGVLPEEKVSEISRLQSTGARVAMVGDGVNDAAALATAHLGIAMGSGTDAAISAADITLVRSELGGVADAIELSRRTLGTIRGNLFWAFAYNVAALPLAAFGLLNPMVAGAAMAFSSVFVVLNSLRLRSFAPRQRAHSVE